MLKLNYHFLLWTRVAGVDVPRSDGLYMLGMLVQSNLHWDKHIFEIAKKAEQIIGLLKRCKNTLHRRTCGASTPATLGRKWNTMRICIWARASKAS